MTFSITRLSQAVDRRHSTAPPALADDPSAPPGSRASKRRVIARRQSRHPSPIGPPTWLEALRSSGVVSYPYGPIACSTPKAPLSRRFDGRVSPSAGRQLPGCLATTRAGLSPASPSQLGSAHLQASLHAADRSVAPPRFAPGFSATHGGFSTGDPGVSPGRTRTGWLP